MKEATFYKTIVIAIIGLIICIFAARFLGWGLGTAAKASAEEAKLRQQSVQLNTRGVDHQIATSRQQDEAAQAVSNITYFSDPRTELCFAYLNVYDAYGSSRSITTVNCGLVPKDLLIIVRN